MQLVWYFDFVSPYAYLQFEAYPELMRTAQLRPVLFAGLLNHWGSKGPAEVPAKRLQTYRFTYWQAGQHGIAMTYPPAHPFNPIRVLRLAIALDCRYEAIKAIFEFIWKEGRSVTDEWPALVERLGLTLAAADARIAEQRVKDALAANGRQAIDRGVYGVPTFDTLRERPDASGVKSDERPDASGVNSDERSDASGVASGERADASGETSGELFWGLDATDMLLDYLADPTVFDEPEMRRIAALPLGAARKP
jgi:2-hydroxychromene-2-carboxylate isomerase